MNLYSFDFANGVIILYFHSLVIKFYYYCLTNISIQFRLHYFMYHLLIYLFFKQANGFHINWKQAIFKLDGLTLCFKFISFEFELFQFRKIEIDPLIDYLNRNSF